MPLAGCVRCKKMFNKTASAVCPKCLPDEESDRDKIRAALDNDSNLTQEQTAEEAEVDMGVVRRMLDEGLLAAPTVGGEEVKCGRCGAPAISLSKKLCQTCLTKLNAEVAAAQSSISHHKKRRVEVGEYMQARKAFDTKRRT